MGNKHVTKIKLIGYKNRNQLYLCKCNYCGALVTVYASHYYRGDNVCKCKKISVKYPHLYGVWINIKSRCNNPNVPNYKDYGARGVTVCDKWSHSFENFLKWSIAHGYRDDLTIDRIDVNGNYEPSNCRWIVRAEQNRNKRNNIYFLYNGSKYCMKEISRLIGINYKTIYSYYCRNGYIETAKKYNLEVLKND